MGGATREHMIMNTLTAFIRPVISQAGADRVPSLMRRCTDLDRARTCCERIDTESGRHLMHSYEAHSKQVVMDLISIDSQRSLLDTQKAVLYLCWERTDHASAGRRGGQAAVRKRLAWA